MVDGFKRIMLPLDFSRHCNHAAQYATWFARISQSAVHLVHIIANPADPLYEPQAVPYWDMVQHSEQKAREWIDAAAQRYVPPQCLREYHLLQGDPFEKLMEVARRIEPDLIVMSTHGRSGLVHVVMGSVAEKIVRHAPCPVFVARAQL
jgi:nucleotide-binding universal stress UspA family protein